MKAVMFTRKQNNQSKAYTWNMLSSVRPCFDTTIIAGLGHIEDTHKLNNIGRLRCIKT